MPDAATATPDPPGGTAPSMQTNSARQAAEVPPIVDFTASRLGGGEVVGAELAGNHVAMWFWAPW